MNKIILIGNLGKYTPGGVPISGFFLVYCSILNVLTGASVEAMTTTNWD